MMSKKYFILFCLVILIFSCEKSKDNPKEAPSIDSIQVKVKRYKTTKVMLNPKAKSRIEEWKEFQKMEEFIQQFYDTSTKEVLLNAQELSELSQQLKDSIRIKELDIPSVKTRLNVLHNETLRLADMATINYIDEKSVVQENENVLNAYAAFKLKMNDIVNQEKLNSDVEEFIEEVLNEENNLPQQKEKKPIKKKPKTGNPLRKQKLLPSKFDLK